MKNLEGNAQAGFSIVELMIVLIVLGVLTTLAILQFGESKVDLERQTIARELKVYLERARFDSVKRRATEPGTQATVTFLTPTAFTASLDYNENGTIEAAEVRTVDFTQKSRTRIIVSDALNYPVTVRFDRRGHAITVDGLDNPVDPVFTICSDCSPTSTERSVISVSTTGTVAVTRDEPDPTSLPTPEITNPEAKLNCYVYVGSEPICSIS